jgi:hypothetical protein
VAAVGYGRRSPQAHHARRCCRNPAAQELLQEALVDRVALDVSFDAQKLVDNAEPADTFDLGDYTDSRHDEQVQDRLDGLQ